MGMERARNNTGWRAWALRRGRALWRGEQGQSSVELALLLPLLALIILVMAQLFVTSDLTIVTVVKAYRQTMDHARKIDGQGGFSHLHVEEADNEMPVLPGLNGLFNQLSGSPLRPPGSPWHVRRGLAVTAGSLTGTRRSAFNDFGDGQGLGGSAERKRKVLDGF